METEDIETAGLTWRAPLAGAVALVLANVFA
jgi:hypothetical protein